MQISYLDSILEEGRVATRRTASVMGLNLHMARIMAQMPYEGENYFTDPSKHDVTIERFQFGSSYLNLPQPEDVENPRIALLEARLGYNKGPSIEKEEISSVMKSLEPQELPLLRDEYESISSRKTGLSGRIVRDIKMTRHALPDDIRLVLGFNIFKTTDNHFDVIGFVGQSIDFKIAELRRDGKIL